MKCKPFILAALSAVLVAGGCGGDDPASPPQTCTSCVIEVGADGDNTLYEDVLGELSSGLGDGLFAGVTETGGREQHPPLFRRALLYFDVASWIPKGSTIDSVELFLTVTRVGPAAGQRLFSIHAATADWGEGSSLSLGEGGGGGQATPGDATWIHRFYDTTIWATPGGDFRAAPSAAALASITGVRCVWGSTPEMVADVQGWLDDPLGNFGWVLIGDETSAGTAMRFASREHAALSDRPSLRVQYTKP
jgi:hypothetical protein